jgi:hypothetical protein
MKKIITVVLLFVSCVFYSQNKGVLGKWKTIDDETGETKSIVEIYEKSGKIYGKVIEILDTVHKKVFVRPVQVRMLINPFLD